MRDYQSLAHTTWDCKYHVVFIPKRRKKVIFGVIRKHLGKVLHELAEQKECLIMYICALVFRRSTQCLT
ncbi:putative transposase [Nitrosomonas sp. Nm33]|nr:putative transposase [Nitrosomonas sp. Nm33]